MPTTIPQSKRLKPKKGFDIVTSKDGKGNETRQRYVKRRGRAKKRGFVDSVRRRITVKPDSGDATGTGGSRRRSTIDEAVEAMQTGVDEASKEKRK